MDSRALATFVLTLDTSAIYAILRRSDPDHARVVAARDQDPGPYFVPSAILSEIGYLVETRLGTRALEDFLADVLAGAYTLDCERHDVPRVKELIGRYADLALGLADASVIAAAERHGGRVLSVDRRDFNVVAREGTITLLPQIN